MHKWKYYAVGVTLLFIFFVVTACGGNTESGSSLPGIDTSRQPASAISAKLVETEVKNGIVYLPVSALEQYWNTRFTVRTLDKTLDFMAYAFDDEVHVRASVCPPCRSSGFTLMDDVLNCDTCGTTFKSKTGDGIQGACVDYPKASVPYEINEGNIVMKGNELRVAYQNTLVPGLP